MNSSDTTSAQTTATAYPSLAADEDVSLQEVSHVFSCMQCDLQFQIDMTVASRNGSYERDAEVVRVRLDPCIKLERKV
jgi:hypothetical protein